MIKTFITRRALLGFTFGLVGFLKPADAGQRSRDRGIGGTGGASVVEYPPEDRGIGGTGVIGTIREFGSIIVNGMRIAYPKDAEVEIDGKPASPADLRRGHVTQVVAETTATGFVTHRIVVASEVVGPIEAIGPGSLTVLGQSVSTKHIVGGAWKKGKWIAVSGLRNFDGTIVASHVQYRDASIARVAGPVTTDAAGAARIAGLALVNLDASLAGQRVLAEVGRIDGAPAALKVIVNPEIAAMPNVRRFSIEAYVARTGNEARFGSGFSVSAPPAPGANNQNPGTISATPSRAIVTVNVNPDGGLSAVSQKPAPALEPSQPQNNSTNSPSGSKSTPATSNQPNPTTPSKSSPSPAQGVSNNAKPTPAQATTPQATTPQAKPAQAAPPQAAPPQATTPQATSPNAAPVKETPARAFAPVPEPPIKSPPPPPSPPPANRR